MLDGLQLSFVNGHFSEKQYRSIRDAVREMDNSLDDPAFKEILLNRYLTCFDLHYCHLAHPDRDYMFVMHCTAGDDEDLLKVYRSKEEHCIFKDESLHVLPATTTLHLDLERWDILKEINPLYNSFAEHVNGFEIISALHPDTTGIIGIRIDGTPIPEEKLAEHSILSPFLINAYHMHRKLTSHRDINTYFCGLLEEIENRAIAFYDSAFRMVSSGKKFREMLQAAGMSGREVEYILANHFSPHTEGRPFTAFPEELRKYSKAISIHSEPVFIENSFYFRVTLSENHPKPVFTAREREILQLLHSGHSNREISDQLGISTETVKRHIYNLFRKTGARNRTELSHYRE